ncbi:hypothetical protein SAMN04488512_12432 [Sulfitobacter litoralis]|uniref:Uncharacterized protein n=1 Tax=Sulfitobacter litoralis TaxID=335975 RepID=A0ABY0SV65_9RHOB|nr:hypothetical protein SAMN04488512_12432 [Sulfitobacter litoralis]
MPLFKDIDDLDAGVELIELQAPYQFTLYSRERLLFRLSPTPKFLDTLLFGNSSSIMHHGYSSAY